MHSPARLALGVIIGREIYVALLSTFSFFLFFFSFFACFFDDRDALVEKRIHWLLEGLDRADRSFGDDREPTTSETVPHACHGAVCFPLLSELTVRREENDRTERCDLSHC